MFSLIRKVHSFSSRINLRRRLVDLFDTQNVHPSLMERFQMMVPMAYPGYSYAGPTIEFSAYVIEPGSLLDPDLRDVQAAIEGDDKRPSCLFELAWAIYGMQPVVRPENGLRNLVALGTRLPLSDRGLGGGRGFWYPFFADADFKCPTIDLVSQGDVGKDALTLTFLAVDKSIPAPVIQTYFPRVNTAVVAA